MYRSRFRRSSASSSAGRKPGTTTNPSRSNSGLRSPAFIAGPSVSTSNSADPGELGRLGRQPVFEPESERGVALLDLFHAQPDHDQVAAVADELRAHVQQRLRVLGPPAHRAPPLAGGLR